MATLPAESTLYVLDEKNKEKRDEGQRVPTGATFYRPTDLKSQ